MKQQQLKALDKQKDKGNRLRASKINYIALLKLC